MNCESLSDLTEIIGTGLLCILLKKKKNNRLTNNIFSGELKIDLKLITIK